MSCEKETFPSEKSATKRLRAIWNMPGRGKKPIRHYQCEKCKKYHLTSKPRL
jgi:uncharacterized protein YlaI